MLAGMQTSTWPNSCALDGRTRPAPVLAVCCSTQHRPAPRLQPCLESRTRPAHGLQPCLAYVLQHSLCAVCTLGRNKKSSSPKIELFMRAKYQKGEKQLRDVSRECGRAMSRV